MANPQAENGYTRIANEILDEIISRDFSKREYTVIFCVLRNTYGWHRKMHRMSCEYISRATGLSRANVSRTRSLLVEEKVLKHDEHDRYGLNKDYDGWGVAKIATSLLPKQQRGVAKLANNKERITKKGLTKGKNFTTENLTAIFGVDGMKCK